MNSLAKFLPCFLLLVYTFTIVCNTFAKEVSPPTTLVGAASKQELVSHSYAIHARSYIHSTPTSKKKKKPTYYYSCHTKRCRKCRKKKKSYGQNYPCSYDDDDDNYSKSNVFQWSFGLAISMFFILQTILF
eukprot:c14603_g1_i1 orf=124-516(+)